VSRCGGGSGGPAEFSLYLTILECRFHVLLSLVHPCPPAHGCVQFLQEVMERSSSAPPAVLSRAILRPVWYDAVTRS